MTLQEFETLVDTYGADASRWPVGQREAARSFMESSGAARLVVAEAQALDHLLDRAPRGEVHASLVADILAAAPGAQLPGQSLQGSQPWSRRLEGFVNALWPQFGWLRPAGLLTATMAFGFYLGFAGPGGLDTITVEEDDLFASAFSLPDATDWDTGDWQ